MTDILLLTAYDETFREIGELTSGRLLEYMGRWRLINGTVGIRADIPADYNRPASWYKIYLLRASLIQTYPRWQWQWLCWFDADACIMNLDFDLRGYLDSLPESVWLVAGSDANGLNAGVLFVRNVPEAAEFFCRVYDRTEFLNHQWWEQAAIQAELAEQFICVPCVGDKNTFWCPYNAYMNLSETRVEALVLSGAPFNAYDPLVYSEGTYKKGDFVLHCPGLPYAQRIQVIKKRLAEYEKR